MRLYELIKEFKLITTTKGEMDESLLEKREGTIDNDEWWNALSDERMAICEGCDLISTKHKTIRPDVHCTDCGCMLAAKTKCLSCACPLNKWIAVMANQEEEEALKKEVHGR